GGGERRAPRARRRLAYQAPCSGSRAAGPEDDAQSEDAKSEDARAEPLRAGLEHDAICVRVPLPATVAPRVDAASVRRDPVTRRSLTPPSPGGLRCRPFTIDSPSSSARTGPSASVTPAWR